MRANLDDLSLLQHDDAIRSLNGGKTVCNDQRSASLHQSFQGGLNLAFRFAVQCGGGFVEDEDGRVLENGACNCDALALASGKFYAALADQRVKSLRHFAYEYHRMGGLCGVNDFCLRHLAHLTVGDIGGNRVIEQYHFLTDQRDVGAQTGPVSYTHLRAHETDSYLVC